MIAEYIGGGFGGKQGAGFEALMAVELSKRTGRPVRLVLDRHGEQLDGGCRPGHAPDGAPRRRAATARSRAVDAEALVEFGMAGWRAVTTPAMTLYRCANARGIEANLRLDLRRGNAFRAPAVMEGITALEQAMDELALALDIDPLELRRRNFTDLDQSADLPYSSNALLVLLRPGGRAGRLGRPRRGCARPQPTACCAAWAARRRSGGAAAGRRRTPPAGSAATASRGSRSASRTSAPARSRPPRMVAAEELGLPLDRVLVVGGDTGPNIYGPVAGGSQTTPSVMPAVRGAAADVKHKLLALAGDVFEASVDDLELRDGRIRSADGALDEPYTEVTEKLGHASIDGSGMRGPNPDGFRANTFGCQIAQVAVDPGTGEVRVERIWAVHDIGRVINPLGASSQVEGGDPAGHGVRAHRGAGDRPHDRRAGQRDARRLQGADDARHAADHRRVRAGAGHAASTRSARRVSASRRSSRRPPRSRTRSATPRAGARRRCR